MLLDDLEKYIQDKNNSLTNDPKQFPGIKNHIIEKLSIEKFEFPVEDDVLLSKGTASFVYKKNKTYPNLFTFLGKIFDKEIPISIGMCKFGPGEILIKADNKADAIEKLSKATNEFRSLIYDLKKY